MNIKSVRIKNFRSFSDETINLTKYSCFVGPNGSGKSTILAALNVFFRQFKDSKTDLSKLSADDFHHKNVDQPIDITVIFDNLSDQAKADLSDYVRQDQLVISAVARYDTATQRADVLQYGNRLGIQGFRRYFEADKQGRSAADLRDIYQELKDQYSELPNVKTKSDMEGALHKYEEEHPENCTLIPSEDQFYGATKGSSRLASHIQWVFVPAVKDITEEGQESKSSGLGQLLARTIRSKVDFSEKIGRLRQSLRDDYQQMLDTEQSVLDELSMSLEGKLKDWAHPQATARILWTQDSDKSVKVEEPWAYIRIGERDFEGELARFGHGMQRSYMLTLLQELASSNEDTGPSMILAIEEPELYQHPPQARYLSEVLRALSFDDAQVLVCSHSPLFVPGDDFESVRVVRESGAPSESRVSQVSYSDLSTALNGAGQKLMKEQGLLAKLYPTLNPSISEMFFCKVLILVEGIEDVSYISSYISLTDQMTDFRRFGCHIVPVGGKSELIKPIAMANQLQIPTYIVFDLDTDAARDDEVAKHKRDNSSILALLDHGSDGDWPTETIWHRNLTAWKTNITDTVQSELGDTWKTHVDAAAAHYGQPGGLNKNPLAVAWALHSAWDSGVKSDSLIRLANNMMTFAKNTGES